MTPAAVDPLRVVVVGAGGGSGAHLHAAQLTEAVDVVSVIDREPGRAAVQSDRFGIRSRHQTWQQVLADPHVECVALIVPPDAHEPLTVEAFAAGKHVVCEKPLARTPDSCDRMTAAADRAGRRLFPVHNRIYSYAIETLAALVAEEAFGRIHLALSLGVEGPAIVARAPWLRDDPVGGVLFAQAVHPLYVLQHLLGPIAAISPQLGTGGVAMAGEDTAVLALRFETGAVGSLSATFASEAGPNDHSITLLGSAGWATTTLRGGTQRQPERITVVSPRRYGDHDAREVPLPPSDGWATSFQRMWTDYATAIRSRTPARVAPADGRATVEVLRAAYAAAARTG